jgi:hypothetical protein
MRALAAFVITCGCGGSGVGGGDDGQVGGCEEHPLETGLVAQQTGVSADAFDCEILTAAAAHAEPDPMLFKAIIYTESRFDYAAIGCTNLPCGQPTGWTVEEAGCLGLMQVVAACGGTPGSLGMLPNGRPNLATDMASPDWPGSILHPSINVEIGVAFLAGNRDEVEQQFSGCTVDQYTLMALSNYGNHGSAQGCTTINHDHVDVVLEAYRMYATAAGYPAHDY